MEKLRQCESIFIGITCISGTTIRTQELPRHTDISKHLPSTSVCCSVAQSCLTLCDPEDFSPPGSPVLHHLPEFAHTHVHWVTDAVQPSCPLSSPSPPAFYFSHHQGLFQWWYFPIRVSSVRERLIISPTTGLFQVLTSLCATITLLQIIKDIFY